MSLRSDLARLFALPGDERILLILAYVLLVAHGLALRGFGLARVRGWFRPTLRLAPCRPERSAWLVLVASRRIPFRVNCLATALTLQWILEAQGDAADLRLGVRKVHGRLEAHAWLERSGVVLVDTRQVDECFLAFDRAIPAVPPR